MVGTPQPERGTALGKATALETRNQKPGLSTPLEPDLADPNLLEQSKPLQEMQGSGSCQLEAGCFSSLAPARGGGEAHTCGLWAAQRKQEPQPAAAGVEESGSVGCGSLSCPQVDSTATPTTTAPLACHQQWGEVAVAVRLSGG